MQIVYAYMQNISLILTTKILGYSFKQKIQGSKRQVYMLFFHNLIRNPLTKCN